MSGSYRVVDPLNRLRLRVRLRLIQDVRLAARDKQTQDDHDATGRVYTYELRWQERVPGPRHALGERSLAPTKKKKKGTDDGDDDAKEQVLEHLKERQHRVFAYAAAEGYTLTEERSLVRDATGAAAPLVPHALAASRVHDVPPPRVQHVDPFLHHATHEQKRDGLLAFPLNRRPSRVHAPAEPGQVHAQPRAAPRHKNARDEPRASNPVVRREHRERRAFHRVVLGVPSASGVRRELRPRSVTRRAKPPLSATPQTFGAGGAGPRGPRVLRGVEPGVEAVHQRPAAHPRQRSPHRKRHVHELPKFTQAQLQRAVRIVLVRNPYDRLLAAYLDKMVLQRKAKLVRRSAALDRGAPGLRLTRSGLLCRDRRRAASSRAAGLKPFWATSRGCSPTRPTSTIGR